MKSLALLTAALACLSVRAGAAQGAVEEPSAFEILSNPDWFHSGRRSGDGKGEPSAAARQRAQGEEVYALGKLISDQEIDPDAKRALLVELIDHPRISGTVARYFIWYPDSGVVDHLTQRVLSWTHQDQAGVLRQFQACTDVGPWQDMLEGLFASGIALSSDLSADALRLEARGVDRQRLADDLVVRSATLLARLGRERHRSMVVEALRRKPSAVLLWVAESRFDSPGDDLESIGARRVANDAVPSDEAVWALEQVKRLVLEREPLGKDVHASIMAALSKYATRQREADLMAAIQGGDRETCVAMFQAELSPLDLLPVFFELPEAFLAEHVSEYCHSMYGKFGQAVVEVLAARVPRTLIPHLLARGEILPERIQYAVFYAGRTVPDLRPSVEVLLGIEVFEQVSEKDQRYRGIESVMLVPGHVLWPAR